MAVRVSVTSSEEECVPKTLYTPPGHVDDRVKSSDEDWIPATPDPSGARPRKPRATGKLSQSLVSKYFDFEVVIDKNYYTNTNRYHQAEKVRQHLKFWSQQRA